MGPLGFAFAGRTNASGATRVLPGNAVTGQCMFLSAMVQRFSLIFSRRVGLGLRTLY
jgi:hypothetical protein